MSEKSAREFIESRLAPPLLHGDEEHQAWLRDELRKWIPELTATIDAELRLRDYTCHVCWTNSYAPCEKDTPDSLEDLKRPGQYVVCQLCSMTEALRQKQFECDYILNQMCDARDYWKRRAEASWEREDQSGGTLLSLANQLRKARSAFRNISKLRSRLLEVCGHGGASVPRGHLLGGHSGEALLTMWCNAYSLD